MPWKRKNENRPYLNHMEGVAVVLVEDTVFARETAEVTIQATVRRAIFATRTGGKGRMDAKTFMCHKLVSKLISELLSPLFEIVLCEYL
jgi:hypothetical protein